MSDFKFACPVCGQHITCDSTQGGSTLQCPTCFQKVVVPQSSTTTGETKFILTGTKVGGRPALPTMIDGSPSVPPGKNSPLAVAVVWLILIATIAAASVLAIAVHRRLSSQHHPLTPANAPAATVSQPKVPAVPLLTAPPANDSNWTLEVDGSLLSDATASGRIHRTNFICQRAVLDGGTLSLRMGDPPELGVSIYLHAKRSADLAGQWVDITTNFHNAPRVTLRWQDDQKRPVNLSFVGGYALRIDFGSMTSNRLSGRLYLSIPDEAKSYVAGTFAAEIRKPRPPAGP